MIHQECSQPAFKCSKLTIETLEQRSEICSKLTTKTPERRQLMSTNIHVHIRG